MDKRKLLFWTIWLVIVSLGPITVLRTTPLSSLAGNRILLVNFVQRTLGLIAFSMIFNQIILGSFMTRWIEKLGAWVFRLHVVEGITAYSLILLHPLGLVLTNYFIGRGFDPFYAFVDVCILCKGPFEWYYNFGRIGFWLVTIAVTMALFRASTSFLRQHWHKFHVLNYVAFVFIWLHSLKVGTDIGTPPFSFFHGPALIIVLSIASWKIYKLVMK